MFDFEELEDAEIGQLPSLLKAHDSPRKASPSSSTGLPALSSPTPARSMSTTPEMPVPKIAIDTLSSPTPTLIYWKVVHPAGVSVRSDGMGSAFGRLPFGAVVLEKERTDLELRYQAPAGTGAATFVGPRSGWVKLRARTKLLMERMGSECNDPKVIISARQRFKALFLLDWDDTLCPTSWIDTQSHATPFAMGFAPRPSWAQLEELGKAVKAFVDEAGRFGTVAIVTMAERPWVQVSLREFLPGAAESIEKLQVFYARESFMTRAIPGACQMTILKRRAMQIAMDAILLRLGRGASFECLVSIGDNEAEKKAAMEVGQEFQSKGLIKVTKTVKLRAKPTIEQMTTQVKKLQEILPRLVEQTGKRNLVSSDWGIA